MDWGALQGLGQGLQQLGSWKMEQDAEKRRTMMAEQLQKDREERAQLVYDPSQDEVVTGDNGVLLKVKHSKSGKELERVPLPPNQVDQFNRDVKKENLTIDSLASQIEANKTNIEAKKKDIAWEEEDRGLLTPAERAASMRVKGGLVPSADTRYSTDGSLQRAVISSNTSSVKTEENKNDTTMTEYANNVIDQYPELEAKFVGTDGGGLTKAELVASVASALRSFSARGYKPSYDDFVKALQAASEFNKNKKSPSKTSGGIKMNLTGT